MHQYIRKSLIFVEGLTYVRSELSTILFFLNV